MMLGFAIDRLYKFFAPALHKGLPQSEAELQSAQPLFWCVRRCFLAASGVRLVGAKF